MSHTLEDDDLCHDNCGFALNDIRFSDRVLNIEIFMDDSSDGLGSSNSTEASASNSNSDGYQVRKECGVGDKRREENTIRVYQRRKKTKISVDSSCSEDGSRITKSTKLHVSSVVLAAKSPFFDSLFTNGMMESEQRCVTLGIHASEETAFMELLNYMYNGTLTSTTIPDLLDVLKAADKFQVVSCMSLCTSLLTSLPLSLEFALVYLDLASSLSNADVVRPLADAAKQFLTADFTEFHRNFDKIMEFPLEAVELIMSNSALRVREEDTLFNFALEWTASHYPKLEDQKKILSTRLGRYIRFFYMSHAKLSEVLSCNKFDSDYAQKVVSDALLFKANTPHHHRHITIVPTNIEESTFRNHHCPFVQRRYNLRPIKAVKLEYPYPEAVIYFDVTREELLSLHPSPSKWICFESFNWDGEPFHLSVGCQKNKRYNFFVGLTMFPKKPVPFCIDYIVSGRSYDEANFVVLNMDSGRYSGEDFMRLYRCPWGGLMAGKKKFNFVDGVLYLKVDLRISFY